MVNQRILAAVICIVMLSVILKKSEVEARYLPTRGNTDRLDKLKELLKELLENEAEAEEAYNEQNPPRWHPDRKLFYKREIPAQ